MEVVLFHSIIERILKINRSMRVPFSHTILIALEGCGAYELVRLAAFIGNQTVHSLFEKDSEHEEDWRVQLKYIMQKSALEREERSILHIEERDLFSTDILEAIDSLTAHGEIFQIF